MENFDKRITKKSDLDRNDSLSGYYGNLSQQNHNTYKVFYNFLKKVKPKRILEIGTSLGGFTTSLKMIIDELKLDTKILTLDIYDREWYSTMRKNGIDVRVENVFNEDYSNVEEYIKNYILEDGVIVILCDGGNKIKEFNLLSNYIKSGDFIMAHDYAFNLDTFKKDIDKKIWNWFEIQESDIKDCSIKNNLAPFMDEEFKNVVWVCKIKN